MSGGAASATTQAAPQAAAQAKHHKPQPHGRFGIVPMRSASTAATASRVHTFAPESGGTGGPLNYGGGPVQHNVQVYLVFWGSQWDSDSNGVEGYMQNLFSGLGTSSDSWSTVTSQYTDSSGSGPTFGGAVLARHLGGRRQPGPAVRGAVGHSRRGGERRVALRDHPDRRHPDRGAEPDRDQPDGFPNSGFCAWHDYDGTVSYTNMPYVLDAGCSCGAD